jgi:hypothetical protein
MNMDIADKVSGLWMGFSMSFGQTESALDEWM